MSKLQRNRPRPVEEHSYAPPIPLELLDIRGVGVEKAKALMEAFGSLESISGASPDAISALPGFGDKLAHRIIDELRELIEERLDGISPTIFHNGEEAEEVARSLTETRHRLANELSKDQMAHADALLDMAEETLKRLALFTPEGSTWEGWRCEAKKIYSRLAPLLKPGGLFCPGSILTCPRCNSKSNVIRNGFENGVQKFHCRNMHDEETLGNGNESGHCHFALTTSLEAQEFICEAMKQVARTLIHTNSPLANAAHLYGVSTYFVEMVQSILADAVLHGGLSCEEMDFSGSIIKWGPVKIIPIWMDFSGSAVAKRLGLLLAKVGDQAVFDINPSPGSNTMSALKMLRNLEVQLPKNVIPVFITDGEGCLVSTSREIFPEAIHIRQFHSKASRGLIHVHFPHDGQLYTLEARWDLVLEDGQASKRTQDQRLRRAGQLPKKKDEDEEGEDVPGDDSWRAFPDHVTLYRGVVQHPRRRRLKPDCSCGVEKSNPDGSTPPLVQVQDAGATEPEMSTATRETGEPSVRQHAEDCPRSRNNSGNNSKRRKEKKEPKEEVEKLVDLTKEEAMDHPIVGPIIVLLQLLFGGLMITSNIVENCFDVKQWLKQARAMKAGYDSLMFRLWAYFQGAKMKLTELQELLDEIFTIQTLHQYLLPRKRRRPGKSKSKQRDEFRHLIDLELELDYEDRQGLVIEYFDRKGNYSVRAIIPERLVTRPNGDVEIHAYCCKRKKRDRTFLLSRVHSMSRVDDARRLVFSLS